MDLAPITISMTFLHPPQKAELGEGEAHVAT